MKIVDIFRKKIVISVIAAVVVIGLSLTVILVFYKQGYSGKDIIITPPSGRTPRPEPSWSDPIDPYPSGGIPVNPLPSWEYNDIYVIGNLVENLIKVIYSDGTVTDITGTKCSYDKALDKLSIALVTSDNELWLIDKDGKKSVNTYIDNAYISDSGEYIYYTIANSNILSRYDKTSGDIKVIYNFSDNQNIDYFAISPDGRSVVCTRGGVTYKLKNGEAGNVTTYDDIAQVLAVTNDLSLVYGYNGKGELIYINSDNQVNKLTGSVKEGNIYFSNTRKDVIFSKDNKLCLFNGSESKIICDEPDLTLMVDENLMKNIIDNVYLVNKSNFAYCYIGNGQYTYMLRSNQEANLISEYKLNFIENSNGYYYIKDDYLYFYDENYPTQEIQSMHIEKDYNIIKVYNSSLIYYLNSENKLCFWNGVENVVNAEQPDIENMCFSPNAGVYGGNTVYLVDKDKGVRIYMDGQEIKLISWTDKTLDMKLMQTPSGIVFSWTENSEDSLNHIEKLYLLNNYSEVLLGTRNVSKLR